MKLVERISLVIFSIIVLVMALVTCFVIVGWLDLELIQDVIVETLSYKFGCPIAFGVSIILVGLSLICIFPTSKEKGKEGILLENENGKLLVSKDTVENISTSVIKNYASVENSSTRVDVDNENKISVFITLSVFSEAVIKDLAAKIQADIKEEVKKSLDLEIKEVNIRVKNISVKKENTVKE